MNKYKDTPTEELLEILRDDAEDQDAEPPFGVHQELARRRRKDPNARSPEEAWERFLKHYAPRDFLEEYRASATHQPHQDEVLTPSFHGINCRHNGEKPEFEIACDECDYYLECYPDWKEGEE